MTVTLRRVMVFTCDGCGEQKELPYEDIDYPPGDMPWWFRKLLEAGWTFGDPDEGEEDAHFCPKCSVI